MFFRCTSEYTYLLVLLCRDHRSAGHTCIKAVSRRPARRTPPYQPWLDGRRQSGFERRALRLPSSDYQSGPGSSRVDAETKYRADTVRFLALHSGHAVDLLDR